MYRLKLYNVDDSTIKHTILDLSNGVSEVSSATLERQINSIDSSSVDLFHSFLVKTGFNIKSFKTMLEIYNVKKNKYEFRGRVITPDHSMESSGEFKHQLTFEGAKAFLKDSLQKQSFEFDKEPIDLLKLVISHHNNEVGVDTYKRFTVGTVNVPKPVIPVDGVYREEEKYFYRYDDKDTLSTIEEDLVNKYGGVIVIEIKESTNVIHWYKDYVKQTNTKISLGENLQSIQYKVDPTDIITRLKPLGASSENANGQEIKLTIADVNNGSPYIDIPELQAIYGIQTGAIEFSDKQTPETLKSAALKWKNEQNKKIANVSISLEALDLELLGIRPDSLEIYNMHLVEVPPLNINEKMKIVGESIDLIQPHNKSVTIGDKPWTMNDIQKQIARERTREVEKKLTESTKIINSKVSDIESDVSTVMRSIKAAETLQESVDIQSQIITGVTPGLTLLDINNNNPVLNSTLNKNFMVFEVQPQVLDPEVSVEGKYYKVNSNVFKTLKEYTLLHHQQYLNVICEGYVLGTKECIIEISGYRDNNLVLYTSILLDNYGKDSLKTYKSKVKLPSLDQGISNLYIKFKSTDTTSTGFLKINYVGTSDL